MFHKNSILGLLILHIFVYFISIDPATASFQPFYFYDPSYQEEYAYGSARSLILNDDTQAETNPEPEQFIPYLPPHYDAEHMINYYYETPEELLADDHHWNLQVDSPQYGRSIFFNNGEWNYEDYDYENNNNYIYVRREPRKIKVNKLRDDDDDDDLLDDDLEELDDEHLDDLDDYLEHKHKDYGHKKIGSHLHGQWGYKNDNDEVNLIQKHYEHPLDKYDKYVKYGHGWPTMYHVFKKKFNNQFLGEKYYVIDL